MGKLLGGLVLGMLAGAATAMFVAPQSGPVLQETLRLRWQEVVQEGQRAAAERRAELEAQFAEAKRTPKAA